MYVIKCLKCSWHAGYSNETSRKSMEQYVLDIGNWRWCYCLQINYTLIGGIYIFKVHNAANIMMRCLFSIFGTNGWNIPQRILNNKIRWHNVLKRRFKGIANSLTDLKGHGLGMNNEKRLNCMQQLEKYSYGFKPLNMQPIVAKRA